MISELYMFVYMISELFWQCGIFLQDFELCWQYGIFDMISELFWQYGIFLHDFWTALSV